MVTQFSIIGDRKPLSTAVILLLAAMTAKPTAIGQTPSMGGFAGDPYQLSRPGGMSAVPAAGRLSADNGGMLDPYTRMAQAIPLNPPIVSAAPMGSPNSSGPVLGPPMGSQSWLGGSPAFPRIRQTVGSRLYLRGEYLLWDVSGMESPPLVTTSPTGTPQSSAGVLGGPGTNVLFGGQELNEGGANGLLLSGGFWTNSQRTFAIEGEYFSLEDLDDRYLGSSDGSVILARPFFNVAVGRQDAQLISFPGLASGSIGASADTSLRSYLINGRIALCPTHGACCGRCRMQDRTDWMIGYRDLRLRDSLVVGETLQSQIPNEPGTVTLADSFQTTNQFRGLQLGVIHRTLLRRAWLETSMRVALGNNKQTLRVAGSTTYDELGLINSYPGGLLAQRTNSGTISRDEFMLMPELGVRLGMRLTSCLHATIGYSVLYLPNVIRASEQIDTDVNPGLIPPELDPLTGPLRPRVLWRQTDYLAHGLHFGAELHF